MNNLSQDTPLFKIYRFKPVLNQTIPGYFAITTAPINVDKAVDPGRFSLQKDTLQDSPTPDPETFQLDDGERPPEEMIEQIAKYLIESESPEIVIAIHGYNYNFTGSQDWYKDIYNYINSQNINIDPKKCVFLGYRWPAEYFLDNISKNLRNSWNSLPILPAVIFVLGLVVSALSTLALLFSVKVFIIFLIVSGILSSIILALIFLRLAVYFRDSYRASKFGVSDLVELIRQLDLAAFNTKLQEKGISQDIWKKLEKIERAKIETEIEGEIEKRGGRIRLNFIGHSLGCLVITDAIRILSDVFDPSSIGTLNSSNPKKLPSGKIGHAFNLGRLVFVAPDIPVETIMPRRANFLRSALRRFEEAYVFSNEGDLALRFASTAANYFSFPAMTRFSGYRLGNLTVKHFDNKNDSSGKAPTYGIVNLEKHHSSLNTPYEELEIRSSNIEHRSLKELRHVPEGIGAKPVADLFTYFDCTDYKDRGEGPGLVSETKGKEALNLWDYISLTFAYIRWAKDKTKGVDTHGGYFHEGFVMRTIYQLAFLGFKGVLKGLQGGNTASQETNEELLNALQGLSDECHVNKIQVVVAPERYHKDILNDPNYTRTGY